MIVPESDRSHISDEVAALGLDVESVVENDRGSTWSVRIVVDRDGGVDLGTLSELSGRLDALAEGWGGPGQAVTLEVTSRGVDAPLTETRHWVRAYGRLVDIRYRDGATGPATARIGSVDADADVVRLVFRRGRAVVCESVPLDVVDRAVVRVEFRPAPEDETALLTAGRGSAVAPVDGPHEGE